MVKGEGCRNEGRISPEKLAKYCVGEGCLRETKEAAQWPSRLGSGE